MSFYMKIDGIEGNVTAQGYQSWIELSYLDLGVGCKMNTQVGHVSNRRGYLPCFTNLSVSKPIDKSSPLLFQSACKGNVKATVLIHACRGTDNPEPYLEYKLEKCIICNYHNTGIGSTEVKEAITEEIELNFSKISMKFFERDEKNSNIRPIASGYDLEGAKSS